MNDELRDKAPSAEEIEKRLNGLAVAMARPLVHSAVRVLRTVRHFGWEGVFEHDLHHIGTPMVFAANHRSHVDTASILGTLPSSIRRRTVVAAALDVFGPDSHSGLRRKISKDCLQFVVATGFNAFAFDRLGPPLRSVRTSVQLIRNGWSLLLYPEGTRSRSGELASFKAGVGLLARFTDRPVIPIHVDGGEQVLPYDVFMPRPGRIRVRYGAPLWYQPDDTPLSFAAKVEERVKLLGTRQAEPERASGATAIDLAGHVRAKARKQPA